MHKTHDWPRRALASTPNRAKDAPHSVPLWAYLIDAAHDLGVDAHAQSCECTQYPQWCAVCTLSTRSCEHLVNTQELSVLQSVDWGAVAFGIVLVELDGKNATKDTGVRHLLAAQGHVGPAG